MLGNRTISGHEIDDNQCAKTIEVAIKESAERADANFTIVNGRNVFSSQLLSCTLSGFFFFLHIICLPLETSTIGPTFDPSLAPPLVEETTSIWKHFCSGPELNSSCDKYFSSNNFSEIEGIPGLASSIISGEGFCVK